MKYLLIFTYIILFAFCISGEKLVPDTSESESEDTIEQKQKEENSLKYVFFPVGFYSESTNVGLGVTTVLFKKVYSDGEFERSDSLAAVLFGTYNKQFLNANVLNLYFSGDLYHLKSTLTISRFPNKFYGFGNKSLLENEEEYTPFSLEFENIFERKVYEQIYIGPVISIGYFTLTDSKKDGLLDDYYKSRNKKGLYTGAGIHIGRDTRDDSIYPRKGSETNFKLIYFTSALLSDYDFLSLLFKHSSYYQLPMDSVLAWEVVAESIDGDAPLNYIPGVGGAWAMRGYRQDRFRDDIYFHLQTEWRVPIWWRFGAVIFASIGKVQNTMKEYIFDDLKPTGGFGLRVRLAKKKDINLRVDFGFSNSDKPMAVYVNLLEAF